MHVLIVNPNTSQEMTESIGASARQYARSETEIVAMSPEKGPPSIEGFFDDLIASEATLELLIQHRGTFDAYIIACGCDSGLFAAREVMEAPVVGIAEAAMLTACMLGYRFSFLDALDREWPQGEDLLHRYGMKDHCVSIRTTGISVLETQTRSEAVLDRLIEEATKALEEDKAEVIILGCAGMSGLDKKMEEILGVPVLDGVVCAVKMVEGLLDYRVSTSKKRAFKNPEPKMFKNCSIAIASVGRGSGNLR